MSSFRSLQRGSRLASAHFPPNLALANVRAGPLNFASPIAICSARGFSSAPPARDLLSRLNSGETIIGDGGLAFALEQLHDDAKQEGTSRGGFIPPEVLLDDPCAGVVRLHRDFLRAGADVMRVYGCRAAPAAPNTGRFTSSKGKTAEKTKGTATAAVAAAAADHRCQLYNEKACEVARGVADESGAGGAMVAASISPSPLFLQRDDPDGPSKASLKSHCQAAYAKQLEAFLPPSGESPSFAVDSARVFVDFLIAESHAHIQECEWALESCVRARDKALDQHRARLPHACSKSTRATAGTASATADKSAMSTVPAITHISATGTCTTAKTRGNRRVHHAADIHVASSKSISSASVSSAAHHVDAPGIRASESRAKTSPTISAAPHVEDLELLYASSGEVRAKTSATTSAAAPHVEDDLELILYASSGEVRAKTSPTSAAAPHVEDLELLYASSGEVRAKTSAITSAEVFTKGSYGELPIVASMCLSVDGDLDGVSVAECTRRMVRAGAQVVGVTTHHDPLASLQIMRQVRDCLRELGVLAKNGENGELDEAPGAAAPVHMMVQPLGFVRPCSDAGCRGACGLCEPRSCTAEEVREYARQAHALGIRYIGGSCGFEPRHIREMADEVAALRDEALHRAPLTPPEIPGCVRSLERADGFRR